MSEPRIAKDRLLRMCAKLSEGKVLYKQKEEEPTPRYIPCNQVNSTKPRHSVIHPFIVKRAVSQSPKRMANGSFSIRGAEG